MLLPINNILLDKLEKEWWGDYASHTYSYPFKDWILWKYNAKVIRPPSKNFIIDLEFNTIDDKLKFEERWELFQQLY